MDETNLIKSRGRKKSSRTNGEEDWKSLEIRWWKRIWKRKVCASMMPKTETSRDDAAEEWSTSGNWKYPAIKAGEEVGLISW